MRLRLAQLITRHPLSVMLAWAITLAGAYWYAPAWDSITYDGDFAYLPSSMPSVVGDRWMSEAFPHQRAKSQFVVAIVRHQRPLTKDDLDVAYDVARRMKNLFGASQLAAARRWTERMEQATEQGDSEAAVEMARKRSQAIELSRLALADAVEMDQKLADYWDQRLENDPAALALRPTRLAAAFHNQGLLAELSGDSELADERRAIAVQLDRSFRNLKTVAPAAAASLPLVDTWTWHEEYFGGSLISRDRSVRLVVLQLANEFMAVDNINVANEIESELRPVRQTLPDRTAPGLSIIQSGSAAVGADMLRSAAAAIEHTEVFSIALIVLILVLVYRTPMLVAIPLITIGVSLSVATSLVALLAAASQSTGFEWWTLKVFSTTRIFIVVILFGAGTDFCLFLIARYKEELLRFASHDEAVAAALASVGNALMGSALTTIIGLGMMLFADFGKFRYSGPVIGLCLAVTLLTCMTLTPALLSVLGRLLFWPGRVPQQSVGAPADQTVTLPVTWSVRLWTVIARTLISRPGTVLWVAVASMVPLAFYGWTHADDVTYDFLGSLPERSPSKMGTAVLRRHFPVGESGPVTVLVKRPGAGFQSAEGRAQIARLSDLLHLPGVLTVRSSEDPLGQYGAGEKPGIISERARQLRLLRVHPRTQAIFVTPVEQLQGDVARLELILRYDPFSVAALEVVSRVDQKLTALAAEPSSFWHQARFALTGTSAAIRDLRTVTRSDHRRIQLLVVVAVWFVLLVLLRRPALSLYMMGSVLLSYYVTLGCATMFFGWAYGPSFQGLDWKVPLFLFVILVAIGQDYNVYLVTRVMEEQKHMGAGAGLRRAVIRTGGIITSCGFIMAGTFISMTSATWGTWLPLEQLHVDLPPNGSLRSIVELGFALALGVLIDTLIIRPILLPAFLALLPHRSRKSR